MRGRLLDPPHHCVLSFRNLGQLDREIIMAFDCQGMLTCVCVYVCMYACTYSDLLWSSPI